MARVDRPVGFRGPLSRWVDADEARTLARKLARIKTREGLARWLDSQVAQELGSVTAELRYRVRLDALAEPVDGVAVARGVIVRAATLRRLRAISHARENPRRVSSAVGSFGSNDSLARCPACDVAVDATLFHFYCDQHTQACEDDLDDLFGRRPRTRRSKSQAKGMNTWQ